MDLNEVKGLIDEQNKLFVQFKDANEKALGEIKTFGTEHADTKAKIVAMNDRFDQIEVRLKQFNSQIALTLGDTLGAPVELPVAMKAFDKFFRYGMKNGRAIDMMTDEEKASFRDMQRKSLNQSTDAGGGLFVPEDFQATVIKKVSNIVGVGAFVSSITTSRDVVRWPKVNYTTDDIDNSALSITWEDDEVSATTTDPTPIGSISIPVKKARGLVLVDRELLEDSAIDVVQLLSNLISDKIAVERDRVVTVGSGGKKPEGFMTNADISTVNSGSSGAFLMDGIFDLVYNLPEQYSDNAQFMCKRLSMGLIRKLKDGQGRYLWEPSTQIGTPATLAGYPIRANEHIAAAAAASKSLVFADFKRLYMLVNKAGLSVQRLDEKYADTDQVGFIFRLRMGGGVVAPWAAKIQVLS
jgi:HK97 family phage major capsid protein